MPPSKLYIRLGSHSEKDYLLKTAKLFSGTILGANLVESTPGATVSLAWKLMGQMRREFAIDPMTYTYGLDLSYITSETIDRNAAVKGTKKVGLKKSFLSLGKQYGGVIEDIALNSGRSITPDDLLNGETIRQLCESVFLYQKNRMRRFCESDPQLKEVSDACRTPSFLFSPYFLIPDARERGSDKWETVTRRIAQEFGDIDAEIPKYSVVILTRATLRDAARSASLMRAVAESGCDGAWVWISDLREESINPGELRSFRSILDIFQQIGKPIFNFHGGFLSAVLSKYGMSGFSHGIGYGESKDVIPVVGAAVPTVNYHYPPLHVRAPILDIERSLSALNIANADDFHARVCNCTICVGTLKGDLRNLRQFGDLVLKVGNTRQSQTPDSAKRCRFHFLLARRKEIDYVDARNIEQLKAELSEVYAEYSSLPSYIPLRDRANHLATWVAGL